MLMLPIVALLLVAHYQNGHIHRALEGRGGGGGKTSPSRSFRLGTVRGVLGVCNEAGRVQEKAHAWIDAGE